MLARMLSRITAGAGWYASAGTLAGCASSILLSILIGASRNMGLHALAGRPLLAYQSIGILAILYGPSRTAQRTMRMRLFHPLHQVGLSPTWLRLS